MEKFGLSRSTVYGILKVVKEMKSGDVLPKRKEDRGVPRKLSIRQEHLLLRHIAILRKEDGNFTVKTLMKSRFKYVTSFL